MHILPREQDKLLLHQAGFLAQKRLARGLQLNINEAIALIASQLQELIRDGSCSVVQARNIGKKILGRRHVLPSVPWLLHDIQVEGTFPDGVFLVSVENPISTFEGDLNAALYGSFLPVPSDDKFPAADLPVIHPESIPGAIIPGGGRITINKGREHIKLKVTSYGDRDIQVGSHYHFAEVNGSLEFDRVRANGMRLDKPAGDAIRFEPGHSTTVTLCAIGGKKNVTGGNSIVTRMGDNLKKGAYIEKCLLLDTFRHCPEDIVPEIHSDETISRDNYISKYGPTVGDRIRLGDTSLWVKIEKDAASDCYGDEVKFGGGKTIREGQGQTTSRQYLENHLDLVITNAVIIDWTGIIKADIGVKNGRIVGIGKAGNPDVMDNVSPDLVIGSSTEVIAGEKLIVTAGALDAHVHYICPQQVTEALAAGTTTMIGGGTGPATGTNATTCTPSPFHMKSMLAATDGLPMNFAFTGKGCDAGKHALEDIVRAGAAGLKLHEDWGSTPAAISACLDVGDEFDVQVNIHTDTLNESGFVENTLNAIGGRTIHTYHTEGAGGGHAPDIIVVCGSNNILPSSTNPTRPYAENTVEEHLDMLVICHHLDKQNAEDMQFAHSRIRKETIAAEDVLHDTGAISMISSDSQAMGRVGEVISRTWRTASKLKDFKGPLTELGDTSECDNNRVKRYVSKYTINPAITHGISHLVGSVEVGKLADLVLWKPENFGAKPEIVLKSGVIAWAQMGDINGSIPIVQPTYGRPMWGSLPAAAALNSVAFVSRVSIQTGAIASYGLSKKAEPVINCRKVTKKDMKWNDTLPVMSVDATRYDVYADGVLADIEPTSTVPLGKQYNFF